MRSHAALVAVAFALLLVTTAVATQPAAGAGSDGQPTVVVTIQLTQNGDAHWTVATRFALNSSNDTAAFERLSTEFENGGNVGFSADDFRPVAAKMADRTGRDMQITDVNRSGYVVEGNNSTTGVLALNFTWTNFAKTTDVRVYVGDAFQGWFDHLTANQQLHIEAPPNYGVDTAPTAFTNGTVTWTGPYQFDPGQPRVTFLKGAQRTSTTNPPGGFQGNAQMVVAVLAALLVGGLLAYVWTHRDSSEAGAPAGTTVADPATVESDGPADVPTDGPSESDDRPDDSDPTGDPGTGPADAEATDDGDDDVDLDLLSDEERVERLLRESGGRMKQATIVTETAWSNAKVSQLLSGMDEAGRIEKLRIGRENLISLPDYDSEE